MKTNSIVSMGIVASIINLLIYAGLFCGGVYFIFWCLERFRVIGG